MIADSDKLQLKLINISAIADIFVETETRVYWERLAVMVEFVRLADRLIHKSKNRKQVKAAEETLTAMKVVAKLGGVPPSKKPLVEAYTTFCVYLEKMHYNEFCTILATIEKHGTRAQTDQKPTFSPAKPAEQAGDP